jgi:hypothetical protein
MCDDQRTAHKRRCKRSVEGNKVLHDYDLNGSGARRGNTRNVVSCLSTLKRPWLTKTIYGSTSLPFYSFLDLEAAAAAASGLLLSGPSGSFMPKIKSPFQIP